MQYSALEPLRVPPGFWDRDDVRTALASKNMTTLFELLKQYAGASQTKIGTATGLGQNRVSYIMRGKQGVKTLAVLTRIADGTGMPDDARKILGVGPRQPAKRTAAAIPAAGPDGQDGELLRRIASARYIDLPTVEIFQQQTDSIRLLDRRLGAPAVAAKLEAHIGQLSDSLRHSLSPDTRKHLAAVLADAAALAGWQAIDMGRLTTAWNYFEIATAAAREAGDEALLAFASAEQAYVLLDLAQPEIALDKVRAVHDRALHRVPRQLETWLHAAEAEMAAAAGLDTACREALDHAEHQASRAHDGRELPYLSLEPAHLARWRGNCLVQLGDTSTITDLTTALTGMDGTFTRAEAGLRCDLAAVLYATGQRGEARQQLSRAAELAQLTGSARQRRRISDLTRRIGKAA